MGKRFLHLGTCVLVALTGCAGTQETPAAPRAEGPARYSCPRTAGPIIIDGRIDEPAWDAAAWTDPFIDIQGTDHPMPRFETRMKMAWDDEALYVAALMEEPHLWATLLEYDSIIYRDNDFEVFIDPDDDAKDYYEIEINAFGTIFDLMLPKPYAEGGHAILDWNVPTLRSAVHLDGTLNDPTDVDRGWSVEMAIPFDVMAEHSSVPSPPRPGDVWRMNFSRVQWRLHVTDEGYVKVPDTPEDNWVWSPQHEINMHRPRRWGYVEFTDHRDGDS
jgi:hypothetical protein